MVIRQNYDAIKKKYAALGKGTVRLTQSTLILIQDISASKDTYSFPVLDSDQRTAVDPNEIRLNQNDEFIVNDLGFYLGASVSGEGVSSKRLLTYCPTELDGSYVATENAYNGRLEILVNKISFVDKWDLRKHLYVPRTQYASSSVGIPNATQPSIDFSKDGMFPVQPNITLSGAKKNDVIITLPAAVPTSTGLWTVPAAPVEQTLLINEFWLIFRGLLGQNASKFQD